jgi:hypothetical protein
MDETPKSFMVDYETLHADSKVRKVITRKSMPMKQVNVRNYCPIIVFVCWVTLDLPSPTSELASCMQSGAPGYLTAKRTVPVRSYRIQYTV